MTTQDLMKETYANVEGKGKNTSFQKLLGKTFDAIENRNKNSGFKDFERGKFYVVAGEKGVGKTAFVVSKLLRMAQAKTKVGLITLKETEDEIACRLVSMKSLVPYFRLRFASFKSDDLEKVKEGIDEIWELPIEIVEAHKFGFYDIDDKIQRLKYEKGCSFIFVDSLDCIYMNPKNLDDAKKFDADEVGCICDIFRQTAEKHNVSIIATLSLSEIERQRFPIERAAKQNSDVLMIIERNKFEEEDDEDMGYYHLTVWEDGEGFSKTLKMMLIRSTGKLIFEE